MFFAKPATVSLFIPTPFLDEETGTDPIRVTPPFLLGNYLMESRGEDFSGSLLTIFYI